MSEMWSVLGGCIGIFILVGVFWSAGIFFARVWQHINKDHIGQYNENQYNLPAGFSGTISFKDGVVTIMEDKDKQKAKKFKSGKRYYKAGVIGGYSEEIKEPK